MNQHSLDFAVIGAQKCATSWMYYCLKDHPEICVRPKKPEFDYIGGEQFRLHGEDWFFDQFSRTNEKVSGDVSVDYLYDSASAPELAKYMPKPRLILSLRNPIERCISSYFWMCRKNILPDVNIDQWAEQLPEFSADWNQKLGSQAAQVIMRGFYADQVEAYLRSFSAADFLVLLYEEIQNDSLASIRRIYNFLGVNNEFVPPNLRNQAKKNSYNPMLISIERKFPSWLTSRAVDVAHQGLSRLRPIPSVVAPATRLKLNHIFRDQSIRLAEMMERFPRGQRPDPSTLASHWNLT